MVPFWKRALSYLTEVHIESNPSPLNPHLYVSMRKGRFQLCTHNAVYSYEDKYDNFRLAFDQINLTGIKNGSALILGFGLGSIPILLQKKGIQGLDIVGVDIDENVVELASRYALNKIHYPTEIICADAEIFVELCMNRFFDLIAIDIFVDDKIPDKFQSPGFLKKCHSLLSPDGILLFNALAATEEDKFSAEELYFEKFTKAFPKASLLDVNGNYIFLHDKRFIL
ncbi:MAG: methyltransferase domain-containing protein [Saprospirales bacterium]|nr:MAG: methyltransferase domain-containing protein [Saprospirales bacterium]